MRKWQNYHPLRIKAPEESILYIIMYTSFPAGPVGNARQRLREKPIPEEPAIQNDLQPLRGFIFEGGKMNKACRRQQKHAAGATEKIRGVFTAGGRLILQQKRL